jgi:glutaredoxin
MIRSALSRLVIIAWNYLVPGFLHRFFFQSNRALIFEQAIEARKMVIKGQVIVYSIIGCPHCMKAKNTLQNMGIPYQDITLDAFPQCREFVKERTGKRTVPQIFFNNIHVGGNDDLQKMVCFSYF